MKKREVTFDEAVEILRKRYEEALANKIVYKPMSYALYKAWSHITLVEKDREIEE